MLRRGAGLVLLALLASGSGLQTAPGAGGGGAGGAPTGATYITQTPDATLTNEQALSGLGTGLMLNTTGTGVVSIYAGNTCTAGQFANAVAANGALTCALPPGTTLLGVTDVASGGTLLARTFANGAGTVVRAEVFPETTIKTDEGAAGTPGTIAWAEAQLTGGGEIYVHAGTYNVGTTITMDVAGTTLRCEDPQTTTLTAKTNLNSTILNVGWAGAQRQGMQVFNCGFNGNPANQSTSGTLIGLKDVADSRIEGNYFRYWRKKGMTIGCSIGATGAPQCLEQIIARNLFFSSGGPTTSAGAAIEIVADAGKPATDSRIVFNDIGGANNDGDNSSAWIKIGDGTANGTNGWSIQGNHVYGWDRGPCVEILDPSANTIDIQNNTLESCTGALKWTGDSGTAAGQSLIQGNKMYGFSRQCSTVDAPNYLGKRCSTNSDCGATTGVCNPTGPVVFDFNRSLRNTITGNQFRSQQGGVTTFIQLRDSGAFGGSNHNLVSLNEIDFTVAGEKGITFANSSSNNVVSGNKCRGIGGGGGGTCIDGGTISNNGFFSNTCNNVCTALEANMPTYANQVHDLNTNVGNVGDFTCATGATPCTVNAGAITNAKLASSYSGVGACAANTFASTLTANAAPTCTQPSFANLSGTASDAQLANAYSGVGACGANTWASTLTRNAAPTCTQPSFANISGSVTDAQVPDTITVNLAATATALAASPVDCSANQYANTIAANGDLTCSQVNFNQLAGTATDAQIPNTITIDFAAASGTTGAFDHTPTACSANQYANAIAASGNLTCAQPSPATLGASEWAFTDPIPDPADSTNGNGLAWTPTVSVTGTSGGTSNLRGLYLNPTYNYDDASGVVINNYKAVEGGGTFTVSGAATQASSFTLFDATAVLDANTAGKAPPTPTIFRSGITMKYSASSGTGSLSGNQNAFFDNSIYQTTAAGGTMTLGNPSSFASSMQFTQSAGTLNITTGRGFYFKDPTVVGTPAVTTLVGVDVERPTKGTKNIGVRNAGTEVYVNVNQNITAATDVIDCNKATYVTFALPSGSQTLTSNPSIADGTTGQICIIQNVGANTLTLTDATKGMDLGAATRVLGTDDTLTVIYGGASGDWVEIAWADN